MLIVAVKLRFTNLRIRSDDCDFRKVRFLYTAILFLIISLQAYAGQLRINEIALTPDLPVALKYVELELYNAGDEEVQIQGLQFFVDGVLEAIQEEKIIEPLGFLTVSFGKKSARTGLDLSLALSWHGGTIMLMAADGERLLDMFIYPELKGYGSFGRCPDGAQRPAYSDFATIGFDCLQEETLSERAASVSCRVEEKSYTKKLVLESDERQIRYTLDGGEVTEESPLYEGPIRFPPGKLCQIKARAFCDGKFPGPLMVQSVFRETPDLPVIALSVKDEDLWDSGKGIYTAGKRANFARKGKEWERAAVLQVWHSDGTQSAPAEYGMRISGSGTRSLPKRSFKLHRRERYDDSPFPFFPELDIDELVLRADATPNSFLQNRFIERTCQDHFKHVDVQPSKVFALYLNGRFWGIYRAMPAKDPKWLEASHGVENIDVLAGSSYRLVQGNKEGLSTFIDLVSKKSLNDQQLEQLESIAHVESMIEMAALDIYTGRADHEFNTRMWRAPGGKWKWVAYDFDLWMAPEDRSLERMLSEEELSAPYLQVIWNTPRLRTALLAELTSLLNGPLSPRLAEVTLKAVHYESREMRSMDRELWGDSLERLDPLVGYEALFHRISDRPQQLFKQLEALSGKQLLKLPVVHSKHGEIVINGRSVDSEQEFIYSWNSTLLVAEAMGLKDYEFSAWDGFEGASPLLLEPQRIKKLGARFRRKPLAQRQASTDSQRFLSK